MALPGYPPILPAIKTPPANPLGAAPVGMFNLGRMQAGGAGGLVRPPMPMAPPPTAPLPVVNQMTGQPVSNWNFGPGTSPFDLVRTAVMPSLGQTPVAPTAPVVPPVTPQAAVTNALMQHPRFAASRGYLRY